MISALRSLLQGLNQLRIQGYTFVWANLAFVALCLPVVTAPAAYSALFRVGHAAFTERHEADLSLFWDTFRANLWRALPWGLAHLLFAIVNFSNLYAYADATGPLAYTLRLVWTVSGIVWLGIMLYTWPIYYEMETPSLTGATRNAFIMVMKNPAFTLTLLAGICILAILSTLLIAAWLLLTWGAVSAIASVAVLDRLYRFRNHAEAKEGYAIHQAGG